MDFQKLLLDVGKALSKDEVKAVAFLCTDLLGRSLTSVELASDLFSRLMDQDHLSAEQPHLLTELLLIIQRSRLIRDLQLPNPPTRSLISPYRKLLYNLSEGITDEDLKHVKFLLNKSLPRRKLEDTVSTLDIFLEMEHMDLISDTNLNLLENIIQSVCPMLRDKITQFKAQQVPQAGLVVQETGRTRSLSWPFQPNPVPQPSAPERPVSCEMPEFRPSTESMMNTSWTSMDLPLQFHGTDDCQALSHELSGLNTETSSSLKVRNDALEMLPSEENKASSEMQTSQTTDLEVLGTYPMTAATRGICLIINNYNFSGSRQGLQNREGTMLDEEFLQKVFKWLDFEVEVHRDCNRQDMLAVFRQLGSRNHGHMDCLVCCVLSHGMEGSVYGVDGLTVKIKEMMESVNGLKCPSLADKPKLFFIQACQGTSEQRAVHVLADSPGPSPVFSDAGQTYESIPCDADFLLGMATVPSFVSFREKKNGTWFIQSLCQNLVQMVPRGCDLVSILTKVNADVSQRTDSKGVKKQMPQPAFSLRKRVVFPIPQAPPPSQRQRQQQ